MLSRLNTTAPESGRRRSKYAFSSQAFRSRLCCFAAYLTSQTHVLERLDRLTCWAYDPQNVGGAFSLGGQLTVQLGRLSYRIYVQLIPLLCSQRHGTARWRSQRSLFAGFCRGWAGGSIASPKVGNPAPSTRFTVDGEAGPEEDLQAAVALARTHLEWARSCLGPQKEQHVEEAQARLGGLQSKLGALKPLGSQRSQRRAKSIGSEPAWWSRAGRFPSSTSTWPRPLPIRPRPTTHFPAAC